MSNPMPDNDKVGTGLIERPAIVVDVKGPWAWVEAHAQSACGACVKTDCGFGVLGKAFGGKAMRIKIPNSFNAQAADRIIIGFQNAKLLDASMMAYLIPALTTVLGALALASHSDAAAALGALGGMLAGFGFLKVRFGGDAESFSSGAKYLRPDIGAFTDCQQTSPQAKG